MQKAALPFNNQLARSFSSVCRPMDGRKVLWCLGFYRKPWGARLQQRSRAQHDARCGGRHSPTQNSMHAQMRAPNGWADALIHSTSTKCTSFITNATSFCQLLVTAESIGYACAPPHQQHHHHQQQQL